MSYHPEPRLFWWMVQTKRILGCCSLFKLLIIRHTLQFNLNQQMYFRQWTRLPFFDAFHLYRRLKLINHLDYNPIFWITRPPELNTGYPLKSQLVDEDLNKALRRLLDRYPDLKYAPIAQDTPGHEISNQDVLLRFADLYTKLRKTGYSPTKAFDDAEAQFQAVIQRKIDNTMISNNLGINNQARSFMSYFNQTLEYESRLKTQRIVRDLQIKQIKDNPPFDSHTKQLMERYRKTLISVKQTSPTESKPEPEKEVIEFQTRAKNVFDCYYDRAATKDKLQGLNDEQILQRIRESPTRIKQRFRKLIKRLDHYGVTLDDDMRLLIPENTPADIKQKFKKPEYTVALMYKDLGFEFQHHKHLDDLQTKLEKLKAEKRALRSSEEQISAELREEGNEKLKTVLQEADIRTNSTYKLFESPEERKLRLEIKWYYQRLDQAEYERLSRSPEGQDQERLQARIEKISEKASQLVAKLRTLKLQLDNKSLQSAGELMFQEHAELAEDREQFSNATSINLNRLNQYFQLPFEERRLTSAAQVNDDIIHNLIRVKTLKAGLIDIGRPEKLTEEDIVDKNQELLQEKIAEQFKISSMRKRKELTDEQRGIDEELQGSSGLGEEEGLIEMPEDLQGLIQRAAARKIENQKLKEQEQKREEAAQALQKGQKGSRKKKTKE